jgi:hypothetical protein
MVPARSDWCGAPFLLALAVRRRPRFLREGAFRLSTLFVAVSSTGKCPLLFMLIEDESVEHLRSPSATIWHAEECTCMRDAAPRSTGLPTEIGASPGIADTSDYREGRQEYHMLPHYSTKSCKNN